MSLRVLEGVRALYKEELFHDLLFFVSLRLQEHLIDEELSTGQQVELLKMLGDAYRETDCFYQSVKVYQRALELSRQLPAGSQPKDCSPVEIRFLMHKSYVREKKFDAAIAVLSEIPKHEHLLKTRSALARLQAGRHRGTKPSRELNEVFAAHQHVTSKMPIAYWSQNELLTLRAPAAFRDLADNNDEDPTSAAAIYFRAARLVADLKPLQAIEVLKTQKNPNARILFELGRLYGEVGNQAAAVRELERLRRINPHSPKGMDLLAALYAKNGNKGPRELEPLVLHLQELDANAPETAVALAYLARLHRRTKEATLLAQRAHSLYDPGKAKAPASLLRAFLLIEQERHEEADVHLKSILMHDARHVDALELSLGSLMSQNAYENVKQLGEMITRQLGRENPRSNLLYAQSIFHLKSQRRECEEILRSCMLKHAYLTEAPFLLMKLTREHKYEDTSPELSLQSSFTDLSAKFERTVEELRPAASSLSIDSLVGTPQQGQGLATPEFSLPAFQMAAPAAPRRQRTAARHTLERGHSASIEEMSGPLTRRRQLQLQEEEMAEDLEFDAEDPQIDVD